MRGPLEGAVLLQQERVTAFHVDMAAMEGVWVSAEHQCAIWCNQLASKLGAMIAEESQLLLSSLQSHAQTNASLEPQKESSSALSGGGNECKLSDVLSKRQAAGSQAVAVSYQHLLQQWGDTKHTSRPQRQAEQHNFWEGLDPTLVPLKPLHDASAEDAADSLTCEPLLAQHARCVFTVEWFK